MALGYTSFVTPSGNLKPKLVGNKFKAPFVNKAVFTHGVGETCSPGEYRQFVKGEFKVAGSVITHVLCGGIHLSKMDFREDGCGPAPAADPCTAYGHRECLANPKDKYTPDQGTGCDFYMEDEPGFANLVSGTSYEIDLTFRADLINTQTGTVLKSNSWTVKGTVTAAFVTSEEMAMKLGESDKIVAVRLSLNSISGEQEVHVVIVRQASAPRLDPMIFDLSLRDSNGASVSTTSTPSIYEVTGHGRTTASVVFKIPSGSTVPVVAEVIINDRRSEFKIEGTVD